MMRRLAWLLTHGRWNPGWKAQLATYRRVSTLAPDALTVWQATALERHLAWARASVPWVRDHAPAEGGLTSMPILGRRDLQAHREALCDDQADRATWRLDATGGSTGEPVRFYHDANYDIATFCTEALIHSWWGVEPWSRIAYIWGDDRELSEIPRRQRVQEWLQGRKHLNAFRVDALVLDRFVHDLTKHRPHVVQGYATALDVLASHLLERGIASVRPKVVRSAAEALLPDARARIEQAFGTPVRDVYGSRESAGLAAECLHGGFHVMAHSKIIEIVDDDGAQVAPGEAGRVLITDLANRASAFIRYENGDRAAWSTNTTCACGSSYPMLDRIYGRTSDFISAPGGVRVHGEWFTHLFYGREDVQRFQVRQRSLHEIELLTEGPADEAALADILAAMRKRMGPEVRITWRPVERIETGPSGKHRFTISDVPFLAGNARD